MKVVQGSVESTDPDKAVLLTGPATGRHELADGTVYDVSDVAVEVDLKHLDELHHLMELRHEELGTLDVLTDDGKTVKFSHQRCKHCRKGGK